MKRLVLLSIAVVGLAVSTAAETVGTSIPQPPGRAFVSAEPEVRLPSSEYLFEGSQAECRQYFDLWVEKAGEVKPPPWVRVLSPERPTVELASETPIEYLSPTAGRPTEAEILLQAAPGYLFKRIDIWGQIDIREEPPGRHAYFIYLSPYNPYGRYHHEAALVYEKPGPQELSDSWELKDPWPLAHVRLFSSSKTKRIHKWQITAHFVRGTAGEAIQKFATERAATVNGKVHIYGTPTGARMGIDGPPHSQQSFATNLPPGSHTAAFSHPAWGERTVVFPILPGINSQVGASLDNGWACYSLPTIPRDIGAPALAALPTGDHLVVAPREVDGCKQLHAWYSKDLATWTEGGPVPVNLQGEDNSLPALCRSKDGSVLLFWVTGTGHEANLMCSATTDGRQWQDSPAALPPFKREPDLSASPSVTESDGQFAVVVGAQWLRGRPGAWGEWRDVVLEQTVVERITAPDILQTRAGKQILAFSGTAFYPKKPYDGLHTSVFVATSETGEKWNAPVEVAHGSRPHLYESGENLWMVLRGQNYLEAHYSRDGGKTWFGPSSLTPLFDQFEQSDIVPVGGGRFAAVNFKRERGRGNSGYLVSLHLGENFPSRIPSVETETYRWEDFPRATNAFLLQDAGDCIWAISPYTGYGRFDKGTGKYERTQRLRTADLPDLSGNTIGALAVEGDDVWIGANGAGVYCLSRSENKLVFGAEAGKSMRFDIITAIAAGPAFVYVGTPIGLEVYNRDDGFWMDFDHVAGLKELPITALASTVEYLWIGTRDGRVERFNQLDKVESPIEWPDGAQPGKIMRLFAQGDRVWIAAKNGIWLFDQAAETTKQILSGDVQDACLDDQYLLVAGGNQLRAIEKATGQVMKIVINSDKYKEPISSSVWSVATDDRYVYASIYGGITRGLKKQIRVE